MFTIVFWIYIFVMMYANYKYNDFMQTREYFDGYGEDIFVCL